MNKTVKISLWVGGIALASYLLYRFTKKSGTTTPVTEEPKSNAIDDITNKEDCVFNFGVWENGRCRKKRINYSN